MNKPEGEFVRTMELPMILGTVLAAQVHDLTALFDLPFDEVAHNGARNDFLSLNDVRMVER